MLGPWYVHADAELNVEYDSLKKALSGIEEGIARLRQLDEDLRADGRVAWYRRFASGRPGIEEPPNADPRAFVAEERRGRDPVVALLIAHEIIRLIPTSRIGPALVAAGQASPVGSGSYGSSATPVSTMRPCSAPCVSWATAMSR